MISPTTGFDATALDGSYSFLDALPEQLYVAVIASTSGTLEERVAGVLSWRESLITGQLPTESETWPAKNLRDMLRKELADLQLPRFCCNQPSLVDELLLDVLKAADDFSRFIPQRQRELFEELKRLEEERRKKPQELKSLAELAGKAPEAANAKNHPKSKRLPADIICSLQNEARRRSEEEGVNMSIATLRGNWIEPSRVWSEIWDVFGDMGELLGRGRDLARNVLRHHGWQEIVRLRKLLESCPLLIELVRTLGRLQNRTDENAPSIMESIFAPVRRALDEWREVKTEFAPHEVHGLTLSDDISRMIPAEAATLGHPVLKYLWHAKRIEHALLTYRVQGVMAERVTSESDVMREIQRPKPKFERGPIIICLDTSGSMHGAPEIVAKAVVLEALRVAHSEKRACFLYSFSGPSSVAELELKLTDDGVAGLLDFLACSFHGGTDIVEPLRRAVIRLHESAWQLADVVLVSDGEFPVPAETSALIRAKCRDQGLRVHGILVGSGYSGAMNALCDPVHRFADWNLQF